VVVPLIDALVVALTVRRANGRSDGKADEKSFGRGFCGVRFGVGVREPPALVVGKHGQLVGVMAVGAKRVRADCSWGGCSTAC
jgi:hypothetical protein